MAAGTLDIMKDRTFTDLHRRIIDFERTTWKYAGAKEAAIRERWAISATRHAQIISYLLELPEAEAYAPTTVRRLRRIRDRRRAARKAS